MTGLRFTRRALRDIHKITPELRRRLEIALDQLMDDPNAGDPLHGDWKGYWKLRMGENQDGMDLKVNRRRDRTLASRKIARLAGHKGGTTDGGPA